MQSHNALASVSVQPQPSLMPAVCATAKYRDICKTCSQQVCGGPRRAPISLADHNNWVFASRHVGSSASQFGERYIDCARQMPGWRCELIGLADIKYHYLIAGREPAL